MRIPDSIVLRTSLLFALLTASVITLMGGVVRIAVNHHFVEIDKMQMTGKLELIRQGLADMNGIADYARVRGDLDHALIGHHDLLVRIDDPSGKLWFKAGHGDIPDDKRSAQLWTAGDIPYRGMDATTADGFHISVGLNIRHHELFLQSFEWDLVMIGFGGLTAMALLSFFATSRGLYPLQKMTQRQKRFVTSANWAAWMNTKLLK